MFLNWLVIIVLGTLGGIGKAIRDTISFNWDRSIFSKIKNDWLRRWLQSKDVKPRHLIWFLWDGWHFGDTLSYVTLLVAMFFVSTWYQVAVCGVFLGGIFQLFFHIVFLGRDAEDSLTN